MKLIDTKTRRILVVDDNESIHEDFKNILSGFDYKNQRVRELEKELFEEEGDLKSKISYDIADAFQGEEAVEMIENAYKQGNPFSLVFMDVRMPPGIDGIETIKKIRKKYKDLEFVICTAYADYSWEEILEELDDPENIFFLKKPFNSVEIKQAALSLTTKWANNKEKKKYLKELKTTINELELSKDSLSKKEKEYRELYNTPVIGLYRARLKDGKLIKANQATLDLFGYENLEEALEDDFNPSSFYPEEDRLKLLQTVSEQDNPQPFEIEFNFNNRKKIHASINAKIYPEHNYIEGSILDITKRKEIEIELDKKNEQLIQAQKMDTIGNLAGGLAHDFNNMLSGIMGSNSILRCKLNSNDFETAKLLELSSTIESAADRASNMVRQLMTLSKKQELSFTSVNLNLAIKHILNICKSSFEKTIDIHVDYLKEKPYCYADPTQIEQILLNLCINASHALTIMKDKPEESGGKINLALEKYVPSPSFINKFPGSESHNYWLIKITDNGVGMDNKTIKKVFDPFFTTKDAGTGLGLSMVYSIVRKHKGFIDIESKLGIGTTFYIYLPILPVSDKYNIKSSRVEQMKKGKGCVLIVDDEKLIRFTARNILHECGYKTMLAEDGEACMEVFKKNKEKINLVLLDISMPKKSGLQVLTELREIKQDLGIIITTGYSLDKRLEEIVSENADAYIQKPFSVKELSEKAFKFSR